MNIIDAIICLYKIEDFSIKNINNGNNRANNAGDALEFFVKNLFANSVFDSIEINNQKLSKTFSYLGNSNNPPDAMLRGGDAIEIKKIESDNSALALNSSYPKHYLTSDSPMISEACRNAEKWTKKDMIYAVGVIKQEKLKSLCFVYGLDYCASEECYLKIKNTIKDGVENIRGIEFTDTRELGHINKVDPLGITYLRVRGMWGIDNPWKTFNYVHSKDSNYDFNFMCIINNGKWNTLENTKDLINLANEEKNIRIENVKIKNPDNPALLVDAKLIRIWR